ncbi:MAG: helix-turn-helix transcriptional regulator [Xenococcaceae cyanobacterium]
MNIQHNSQKEISLKLLREKANLTQFELRKLIGVSERRLSDWENGKAKPNLENAVAIARTFQVSLKTVCELCGINVADVPNDRY